MRQSIAIENCMEQVRAACSTACSDICLDRERERERERERDIATVREVQ